MRPREPCRLLRGRRSWPAARGVGSGTWPSACAATQRLYGQWEGYELDDELHWQFYVPVGFPHDFCVLSEVAESTTRSPAPTTPRSRPGSWDDPEVSVEWPLVEEQVSRREAAAPRLADVADDLRC